MSSGLREPGGSEAGGDPLEFGTIVRGVGRGYRKFECGDLVEVQKDFVGDPRCP